MAQYIHQPRSHIHKEAIRHKSVCFGCAASLKCALGPSNYCISLAKMEIFKPVNKKLLSLQKTHETYCQSEATDKSVHPVHSRNITCS